ncbi:MAG: histidine phosphatase family protein, partial [Patescibacteria group bacterium]|nr:histidine phosphatase family protein [Patescibacteria group bacterium]
FQQRLHATNLVDKGIESAKKVGEKLKKEGVEVLISSDLKRARQTAEIIAQKLEKPVEVVELEGLREINAGTLTGKTQEQINLEGSDFEKEANRLFKEGDIRKINFPGGDSFETASQRVQEALKKIISDHGDKTKIAIVAHGNINRVMLNLMFPEEYDFISQLNLSHVDVVEIEATVDEQGELNFGKMNDITMSYDGEGNYNKIYY